MSSLSLFATRASLLAAARDPQNRSARDRLLAVYDPVIRKYCQRLKLNPEQTDEISQIVALRLLEGIADFAYDKQQGGFRCWLYTVTHHAFASVARKRQRDKARLDRVGDELAGRGGERLADVREHLAGAGRKFVNDSLPNQPEDHQDADWQAAWYGQLLKAATKQLREEKELSSQEWSVFEIWWKERGKEQGREAWIVRAERELGLTDSRASRLKHDACAKIRTRLLVLAEELPLEMLG